MQGFSVGAGLAALAFWGFIASVVVAGIWFDIRKRQAQHETVRRLVESGQPINQELMDKLLAISDGKRERLDRYFKIAGLILLPVAVGLAILGLVLGIQTPQAQLPLLGVAALVACIGLGMLWVSKIAESWYSADDDSISNQM
jgi:hypothetical protein